MATEIRPGQKITANGTYYIDVTSDTWYNIDVLYVAGTGTVTLKRAQGDYGTAVAPAYKLPYDVTTDVTFTATGLNQAKVLSGNVDPWIVFTVASASSLELIINCRRTAV